jgi:C4-dicarboxylate-specific signal transduction histidine kinase
MPDGRVKFVKEQCLSDYNNEGSPVRSIGTVQDITETTNTNAAVQNASKMASLGEMAAGIAHEINNPLTIIQGKAGQLKRMITKQEIDPVKLKDDLEKITETVERISNIINALRTISRNSELDTGSLTNLNDIIQGVMHLSFERFKQDSILLKVNVDLIPKETQVFCRASEISLVLLNLLNNSFDAIKPLEEKWIEIAVEPLDQFVKIIITDSGKGIPQSILDKLMQPFFTTKEVGKGTGLGLSISKKIIEKHNGKFYYNKASNHTSFILELPTTQPG